MTSYASFDSGNIRVVEKAMEEAFPHVQLRLDPALDEVRVRIQRGAQFEAARAGNDQRWREACEGFRRVDRCNERVLRIRAFEISEATAVPPVLDTTRASPSGSAVYVASPPNPAPVGEPAPAQKMP